MASELWTAQRDPGNGHRSALQHSLVDLLQALVRTPSRADVDSYGEIFALLNAWLNARGVRCETLVDRDNRALALVGRIGGGPAASAYVLNATVDTAGFGNVSAWTRDPTSAVVEDGWMYGRGSADSKAGVSIFCHLLAEFQGRAACFPNALGFVFDADEHTGKFRGIRSFLEKSAGTIAGVMIGYPGNDYIATGARGFWRATVRVFGLGAHSGASQRRGFNALTKATSLVGALDALNSELGGLTDDAFPLPPKLTVTGMRGGGEFSMVPDCCEIDVDVRLTPAFPAEAAAARVLALVERIDAQSEGPRASDIAVHDTWPAYRLAADLPLVKTLTDTAERVLGRRPPARIVGPSNVGNLLADHRIPATCGFGVTYRNVHAPDECIGLASLEAIYRTYQGALEQLLATASPPAG